MAFLVGGHFGFKKNIFLLHLIKKTKGFHMRDHFFLYYGWFLQNLRKDFIQTNMHTTVFKEIRYFHFKEHFIQDLEASLDYFHLKEHFIQGLKASGTYHMLYVIL